MSVSIRLAKVGKKNFPIYRVVVTQTRSKRDGRHLAILGIYNPGVKPPIVTVDEKKMAQWIKNGAIISAGVRKLLKKDK